MFIRKLNNKRRLFIYKFVSPFKIDYYKYDWVYFPAKPKSYLKLAVKLYKLLNKKIFFETHGIIECYRKIDDYNMRVLAVGLGSGGSLIYSLKNRIAKHYSVIEASDEQIFFARKNIDLNSIDHSKISIYHGFAGMPVNVFGEFDKSKARNYDVNNFDFDILELGCEGSEIEILQSLTLSPKYIIVELHPNNREFSFNEFLRNMEQRFILTHAFTIDGEEQVSLEKVKEYFSEDKIKLLVNREYWNKNLLVMLFKLRNS